MGKHHGLFHLFLSFFFIFFYIETIVRSDFHPPQWQTANTTG
jgi:hypothetical protein